MSTEAKEQHFDLDMTHVPLSYKLPAFLEMTNVTDGLLQCSSSSAIHQDDTNTDTVNSVECETLSLSNSS